MSEDRAMLARPALKWAAVAAVLIVVLVQWGRIVGRPYGDFHLHYRFAQHFMRGDALYDLNFHRPYPPFWAMAHVPLLPLPMHTAQIVTYPLGLLGGVLLIAVLMAMSQRHTVWHGQAAALGGLPVGDSPFDPPRANRAEPPPARATPLSSAVSALRAFFTDDRLFWTVMLAIVLASRYLIRDLVECSVNTWLVALTWLGIYLWIKGRDAAGGLAIGFAIALKMTAALFVPYFLLKRQWKMAGFTMLFAVLFTVAPALRLGPASMAEHLRVWATRVIEGSRQPDPSRGILGDEPYNNMSLRPAMGRYLTALPQGHAGRINHVGYVDVLSLEPRVAGWIVRVATVTLVLGAAWAMRRPVTRRDDSAILWECAAVSVLLLLLSPITWGQHCVGLFPAMFLIAGRIVRREPLALWMKAALFFFIIASLVLNRGILGKEGAILVESYRPETWAILGIFLVTLACARRSHAVPA